MAKILIIDDDYSIVELLTDILVREGLTFIRGMQKKHGLK